MDMGAIAPAWPLVVYGINHLLLDNAGNIEICQIMAVYQQLRAQVCVFCIIDLHLDVGFESIFFEY